ncbi:Mut7-C RNAse domain-containing protein [Thiolapillus sp.]
MKPHAAKFRFHDCLNDLLPPQQRNRFIGYSFSGHPGVKDPIEALGVPHSETGHILANGLTVNLAYSLQPDDRIEVYPRKATVVAGELHFIVDVNLGKLARWLRLLGFDTLWRNDLKDREIVDISMAEQRIILTRDRRLLFHREIEHGYWIRAVEPDRQVPEILNRLDLWQGITPFHRCALCNGLIQVVVKEKILDKLEPLTRKYYDDFYQCADCGQIYWKGSHHDKLLKKLEILKKHA